MINDSQKRIYDNNPAPAEDVPSTKGEALAHFLAQLVFGGPAEPTQVF
jgi:hypothetical protein